MLSLASMADEARIGPRAAESDQGGVASNPPAAYLTLSPDSEPMRLESLCVNCERNVRPKPCHPVARITWLLTSYARWGARNSLGGLPALRPTPTAVWRECPAEHTVTRSWIQPRISLTTSAVYCLFVLQGVTTFMMTRIPFFREVVIMAFECQHCNFRRERPCSQQQMWTFGWTERV